MPFPWLAAAVAANTLGGFLQNDGQRKKSFWENKQDQENVYGARIANQFGRGSMNDRLRLLNLRRLSSEDALGKRSKLWRMLQGQYGKDIYDPAQQIDLATASMKRNLGSTAGKLAKYGINPAQSNLALAKFLSGGQQDYLLKGYRENALAKAARDERLLGQGFSSYGGF